MKLRRNVIVLVLASALCGWAGTAWPASGERFFRFRWDPVDAAVVYEIQMAQKEDFSAEGARLESKQSETTVRLTPGRYFWRVRARDARDTVGAWSPVRKIEVAAPPAPPPPTEARISAVAKPAPAPAEEARIRQKLDAKTGWENYSLPPGKILKLVFETSDSGAGADKVLIKVNQRDFQTYPGDRLLLEADGMYHVASYAVDRVGNRSVMRERKIRIDSTGPVIHTKLERGLLIISAEDAGIGLDRIEWRAGDGDWRTYATPIPAEDAGAAGRIEIRALDALDNAAVASFDFGA